MLEIPTWTDSSKGTKRGKSTAEKQTRFVGSIEVDETYIGGKESNKHVKNRLRTGKGTAGKIPVAGVKCRDTKEVRAIVVDNVDEITMETFIHDYVREGATVEMLTQTGSNHSG